MAPSDFCILSLWGAAAATAGHRPSCPPAQDTGRQFPHPPAHPIPCSSYRGKRTRCSGIGHNKQDSVFSQKSLPLLEFCIRTGTALPAMQMPLYMLSIAKNPARCNPKRRACAQKGTVAKCKFCNSPLSCICYITQKQIPCLCIWNIPYMQIARWNSSDSPILCSDRRCVFRPFCNLKKQTALQNKVLAASSSKITLLAVIEISFPVLWIH